MENVEYNKLFLHTDRNINFYGRVSMWPDSTRDGCWYKCCV